MKILRRPMAVVAAGMIAIIGGVGMAATAQATTNTDQTCVQDKVVPVAKLLFRVAGTAAPDNKGGGYVFDNVKVGDVGPVTFDGYTDGSVDGQHGWSSTGAFDQEVVAGGLRISNATTSGSFGDQTFTPATSTPAREGTATKTFNASFDVETTFADMQKGLSLSVSPDSGLGDRMSYLRFEDKADGVHVFFLDVQGMDGGSANFVETDIATLNRDGVHHVGFALTLVTGPANDIATVTVDTKTHTGTTWEDYYRYDPEQADRAASEVCTVTPPPVHKVWVCKYVGTPGVDEHLKRGKQPISVDANSTAVGGYFTDGQGRSYVLAKDPKGSDAPDVSECPVPVIEPPVVEPPVVVPPVVVPPVVAPPVVAPPVVAPVVAPPAHVVPVLTPPAHVTPTGVLAFTGAESAPLGWSALIALAFGGLLTVAKRFI